MLIGIALAILFTFYLICCWQRWLVARHYRMPFKFMGIYDFLEAWDHLGHSQWCFVYRLIIIAVVVLCFSLIGYSICP